MDDALTEGKRSVKRFIHISDETFVGNCFAAGLRAVLRRNS